MSTNNKRLLLIFLKEPIAGKVKTRLAKTMGNENAKNAYLSLVSILIKQLKWIPNCHYRFCYAPSDAKDPIQHWILPQLDHTVCKDGDISPLNKSLPSVDFCPQSEGDLGDRLGLAFKAGFEEGFSGIAAIGTDCPYLSARWIDTAFLSGKDSDITLGPTYDGGYYFISMKAFSTAPFRNIPWSTEQTLPATLNALNDAGLNHHLLPKLSDVDFEDDWDKALESPLGASLVKYYEDLS